eukprot:TRINITY_DN26904_c0_g1_i2.p1 TRINITY_DN26904_c0_g1~~TRINITY_DN26904_c0_g1_i2.p1  ORF type:complete len:269 (+),score=51.71 TRINITY_DN26904_c0_g1_i2:88-894(+)
MATRQARQRNNAPSGVRAKKTRRNRKANTRPNTINGAKDKDVQPQPQPMPRSAPPPRRTAQPQQQPSSGAAPAPAPAPAPSESPTPPQQPAEQPPRPESPAFPRGQEGPAPISWADDTDGLPDVPPSSSSTGSRRSTIILCDDYVLPVGCDSETDDAACLGSADLDIMLAAPLPSVPKYAPSSRREARGGAMPPFGSVSGTPPVLAAPAHPAMPISQHHGYFFGAQPSSGSYTVVPSTYSHATAYATAGSMGTLYASPAPCSPPRSPA